MSYSSRMSPSFDVQKKINELVNFMLQVQYDYTAIMADLQKEDPTQIGVRKFLKKMFKTVWSDVQTLIKIQEDFDGQIDFTDLSAPCNVEFDSLVEMLQEVLKKEKKINKKLVELHSRLERNDETPAFTEKFEEMVQWRDHIIKQIVEHIIHLEQNEGTVGEFTVSKMMQEEYLRLKQVDLQEKLVKHQSLLPTTPEQQRKQLSSSSTYCKRTILSAKRRQQQ